MSKPASHERDQQILDLLDGNLPEDQQSELRNWLDQSSKHYDRFVELSFLHSQLAGQLNSQRSAKDIRLESLQAVPFEKHAELPPIHLDATTLTKQKYASALSYVLRHTFKPRRVAVLAIAAALLLGVTLLVVFIGDNDTANTTPELASPPREPGRDGPAHNQALSRPIVATLTNDQDAVWDHRPGEDLYAGQRFVLNEGFAEITTADGAIAFIEAPASIELLDNDNAIRLHAGKLVGICETDASKGFVVRTPHMDIIDLGTRFGVDADAEATEVHVFEGEVQAERVDAAAAAEPVTLVANQSARTSADTDVIARIDHDAVRFAALLPNTIWLPGTGQGVAAKQKDPNWQIVAINGQPLPNPRAVIAGQHGVHVDTSKPNHTQWVSMRTRGMRFENGQASFIFRTSLDLPAAVQPGRHRLAIRYMADNELRSIRVNGQPLETNIPQPESIRDFSPPIAFEINPELKAGPNVIEFEVIDHAFQGTSGAYVGLYIDWELLPLAEGQGP